jgi:membrane protease YdiL (CAAX protease family)
MPVSPSAAVRIFVRDRKLRPLWRALLYVAIGSWVVVLLDRALNALRLNEVNGTAELSATYIAIVEGTLFVGALATTALFAWYEGRRVDDYGLPLAQAFRGRFWEGFVIGVVAAALVACGMLALGAMRIDGFALHGTRLLTATLAWAVANLCVGLAEELWYRSYLLQTLWESVGFWPAAVLISLLFTSGHFSKPGENLSDAMTLFSLGLLACYSVLRTGTLWLAVGFHVAFDFMQLFVIGTRNGSRVPVDHLLATSFPGPAWLTGGALGTEASWLMYPVTAALFVYVWARTRRTPPARA